VHTQITTAAVLGKPNPGPSMYNGKPYRTKSQKALAKANATKRDDGAFRSSAPVTYHPVPKS